jgi:pimeloyl-ACP methyl ester carboxylesterase
VWALTTATKDVFTVKQIEVNGKPFEIYQAGKGDRLALCLHGFPEHAISWHHQVRTLTKLGYQVWAPNQRGYGKSYRPEEISEYVIPTLLSDIAGIIDASQSKSVTLIAHDWGAAIAWLFAIRQVRPLERLIIMNAPHPMAFAKNRNLEQTLKSWYFLFFQMPWLPELFLCANHGRQVRNVFLASATHPENFSEDVLQTFSENVSTHEKAKTLLNWYRANIPNEMIKQIKAGIPTIETPTLMIWGEGDAYLLKKMTDGTENYVKDFRIRFLPGISHWVQNDAPNAVNAMIEAFLSDRLVPEYADVK